MEILKRINKANQIWEVLPSLKTTDLVKAIKVAADAYYEGKPIISDRYYDILVDKLKNRDPNNKILTNIGSAVGAKVKLPFHMGSMDKIKTELKVLENWLSEYAGPYICSDKLDGLSGQFTNGILYTRGNGTYGRDVTHLINLIDWPKVKLPKTFAIRGEFIITKERFAKYEKEFVNARSFVSGVVNSKPENVNPEYAKEIEFVTYEIMGEQLIQSEQLKRLDKYGFSVVWNTRKKELTLESLQEIFETRRRESPYEIDGIIVTDNNLYERNVEGNPPYAFAYKGPSESADVKVLEVIWTPSMYGVLIPRVRFEPILLSQATLEYASGFNAKFIVDSGIGPGAIITVVRSGGVIPDILDTKKPVKPSMPKVDYEWDEHGTHIRLTNPGDNSTVLVKQLTKFVREIGAENVSEGIVKRIVEAGYFTIQDIIDLTVEDLLEIPGFKQRMANKVIDAIQGALEKLDIITLMVASNQFGQGFAYKRLERILSVYPDIVDEYDPKDHDAWRNRINDIDGFNDITTDLFLDGLEKFQEFYDNIDLEVQPFEPIEQTGDRLAGQVIVFTGLRANELAPLIEAEGGKIGDKANSKTTIVVYKGSTTSASAKYAKDRGLPLLTKEEFVKKYLSV